MSNMILFILVVFLLVGICVSLQYHGRSMKTFHKSRSICVESRKLTLQSTLRDYNQILLCLEPTSKTTTINDPTAGMTPDEITNYISNVGGGMCGYPELIRTSVGLGLNISLVLFAFTTMAYVVLSIVNFVVEKQVTDAIKSAETYDRVIRSRKPPAEKGPSLAEIAEEMALPYMANTGNAVINSAIDAIKKSTGLVTPTETEIEADRAVDGGSNASKDGTNRQARRLKKKISKNNNP